MPTFSSAGNRLHNTANHYFTIILEQFLVFYSVRVLSTYNLWVVFSFFFPCSKKVTIVLPCTCLFHSLQKASIPGHGERSPVCFPHFSGGSLMLKEADKSLFWRFPSAFASWDHTQEFYTNQSEVQTGLCANVLLLLLSRFSRVWLCAIAQMAAH